MNCLKCIKICLRLFICSLFILVFSQSHAGDIQNLYEAKVLVKQTDHSKEGENQDKDIARQLLLNQVFIKVLYKVTGSKDFLQLANADKMIDQSEFLVQKFAFQSQPKNDTDPIDRQSVDKQEVVKQEVVKQNADKQSSKQLTSNDSSKEITSHKTSSAIDNNKLSDVNITSTETQNSQAAEQYKTWFWARFNKQATDQLLKDNQLAVWGHLRPDTLIWLSIENPPPLFINQNTLKTPKTTNRDIISKSTAPLIIELLNKKANQRGINLLFPFGDLEDKNKLSISDLWGNYTKTITAASTRYHPQAVLAIRIFQEPSGLWIAKWSLSVLDKTHNWQSKDENLAHLLSDGIDSLADKLAVLFALQADTLEDKKIILQINNVTDFNAYQRVGSYFKRITAIQNARLIQLKGDSLSYRIQYIGDQQHLIQSLILGEVLQKVENSRERIDNENTKQQAEYTPVLLDIETTTQPTKSDTGQAIVVINQPPESKLSVEKPAYIKADVEFWLAQ